MPNHVHAILEIDSNLVANQEIKIKSLSSLIGAYKTTSSKHIHLAGLTNFAWQRSFHDHIIRNDASYERISNYIDTNQDRWKTDKFFEKQ
jgi:REP element-mobilizing transposase RayT